MKLSLYSLILGIAALTPACVDNKSTGGVDVDQHNDLVAKYHALIKSAGALHLNVNEEIELIEELEDALARYNALHTSLYQKSNTLLDRSTPATFVANGQEIIESVESFTLLAKDEVVAKISELERNLLITLDRLDANAPNNMKSSLSTTWITSNARSDVQLKGSYLAELKKLIYGDQLLLLNFIVSKITSAASNLKLDPSIVDEIIAAFNSPKKNQIQLNEEEEEIASSTESGNSAVYRQNGQTVVVTGENDIVNFASSNGFNVEAAKDAFSMASNSNGIIGFARSEEEVASAVQQVLGHIKNAMNQNADKLELIFALDISGSMEGDIEDVVNNLVSITDSLSAVQSAGREVKIGIVTFGKPSLEKVTLALTNNLVEVRQKLRWILNNFNSIKHHTDDGEASYYGLNLASKSFSGTSSNTEVVLITDEEAYSRVVNDSAYIQRVESNLRRNKIDVTVYPIITQ